MWNTFILEPMINALIYIYNLLGGNFGLAILIFTALVRLITLPLTYQQMRGSLVMQEIQQSDKFKKMQEKYKDDRQQLAEKQMELYREFGYNPFSGCVPLVIQFPVIIGLYQAIIRTMAATPAQLFDLSKHIYDFIPAGLIPLNSQFLWIANLGQPERWRPEWLPFEVPVLAILVVISTYLQTKLTTAGATGDSQTAGMTQMMSLYMPLLLGYFAYSYAGGLALYFFASNLLGIVQGVLMRWARDRG